MSVMVIRCLHEAIVPAIDRSDQLRRSVAPTIAATVASCKHHVIFRKGADERGGANVWSRREATKLS